MSSRDITVQFHADIKDLEAALARAGLASEETGKKIGDKFNEGTTKAAMGINRLSTSAAGLELPFVGAFDAVSRKLDEATVKTNRFTGLLAGVGKTAVLAGGAGLVAVGGEALRMGENFQKATVSIQNSAHISAGAAQSIGNAFLDTATKSTFSGQAMADAYAAVAGKLAQVEGHALSTGQATKFMSTATDLAEASQTNLSTATGALSKILGPFHVSLGQAAQAANVLYNTSRVTAQPIDVLAQSAARLKGRLGILAPSFTDIGALMVKFQSYGLQGSRAMMQVNTAFQTLVGTSKPVHKVLQDLGVQVFDSQGKFVGLQSVIQQLKPRMADMTQQQQLYVTQTLFGKQAGQAMLQVIEAGVPSWEKATHAVQTHNAMQTAAAAQAHTLHGEIQMMSATVQDLGTKLGLYLIPKLAQVASGVSSVVQWFGKHQAAAEALAAVIAGVLGTAITVYAYTRAVAFVSATKGMISDMGKLASGIASAAQTIATKFGLISSSAATSASEVEASNATMAADVEAKNAAVSLSNESAGASWTLMGTSTVPAAVAEVEASTATMASDIEAQNAAVIASNEAVGASWTALLGPIGLVAAAAAGAYVSLQNGNYGANATVSNAQQAAGAGGRAAGVLLNQTGTSGLPSGYGGGAVSAFFHGSQLNAGGLPQGYGGGALSAFQGGSSGTFTQAAFAVATLQGIGAPLTPTNINAMIGWMQREGNNPNVDKNNPLDTTLGGYGGVSTNSVGVKSYPSAAGGLAATVKTLQQSNFAAIVASLMSGHGLSGPGVGPELSSWSGGGYSSTPTGTASNSAIQALINSANGTTAGGGKATMRYYKHQPVGMMTTAQWQAWQLAHGVGGSTRSLLYTSPISGPGVVPGRTDEGMDFSAPAGTAVHAIGAGTITRIIANWFQGQPMVQETLSQGPNAGKIVYYAEQLNSLVQQGQKVSAGQTIGRVAAHGTGLEFGFGSNAGPHYTLAAATTGYTEGQATPAGKVFAQWMAQLAKGSEFQTTKNGIVTGGSNLGYTLNQALQTFTAALTKQAQALITSYQSLQQSGTTRTLARALGYSTGGKTAVHLHGAIEQVSIGGVESALAAGNSPTALDQKLIPILEKSAAGSQAIAKVTTLIAQLNATGQGGLAKEVAAQLGATFATLAQELYALQVTKDAESLQLQATQGKDQATLAADTAAKQLQIVKDENQQMVDSMTAATDQIKDAAAVMSDVLAAVAQKITDATTLMADASNSVVQGISDNTQVQVDILGERGLFGLNLIAQKEQVQLDQAKAYYDQQIDAAQQNLDATKAQWAATVAQAQINVDQVQLQEDQLVATAQQNADTVTVAQDVKLSAAQSHVDSVALAQDIAVQLAQTAVDLSATAPKAQQDITNAVLRRAQASANQANDAAQASMTAAQSQANALIEQAQEALSQAQGNAATAEANAQAALTNAQGQSAVAIANAQQAVQGIQDTAAQVEAGLQSQVSITQAEASTQYAGSGLVVNMYGIDPSNAEANASAFGWILRTQVPA